MSSLDHPLPELKKPVKFTPASLRLMQACEKAFASNNFLLLYFTNSKSFTSQFTQPDFIEALRNKFQFLQLSRADRAGNWLTTVFHVKRSPYFAILDPSNGQYLDIRYGDIDTPTLQAWLQSFVARGPQFALPETIFTDLIQDTQTFKKRATFSYGTKIRINFAAPGAEDKVVYVNKAAPLEIAFQKYCGERGIDLQSHYFLYQGVELPTTMSAAQMGIRNGDMVEVHHLDDKISVEPLSITVIGLEGSSSLFNVTRGRKLGAFLKSYCDLSGLNPAMVRFSYKSMPLHEELTFAEHNMRNGDQLLVHHKEMPRNEFMYSVMGEAVGRLPEQFDLGNQNPNLLFYYGQGQGQAGRLPGPPTNQGLPQGYTQQYAGPQAKSVQHQKPHEGGPGQSIWESFDMPMP